MIAILYYLATLFALAVLIFATLAVSDLVADMRGTRDLRRWMEGRKAETKRYDKGGLR